RQYYQYGFWKVVVIRKHHLPASWRHLVPVGLILALVLLPLLGLLWPVTGRVALALLGTYLIFVCAGAVNIAARRGFDLLPLLPPTLAIFHFSYGLGFLFGLLGGRSRLLRSDAGALSR
ncbi:MAG: glycosyltransferase family 2 protein, partial [bacterium]